MSYPSLCAGCSVGEHDRHDPNDGTRRGLIGGTHCDCPGDCAPRFAAAAEAWNRIAASERSR